MKCNTKKLPLVMASLGFAVLMLRTGLYLVGTDEKGLLRPWHILDILCWAVTAAAVLLAVLTLRKLNDSPDDGCHFRFSTPAALGSFALAAGIGVAVIGAWDASTRLELIRNLCGVLAVPAMLLVGYDRWLGKKPCFVCHGLTCLYLTLYMVGNYQVWCSQPQTQDYFFSMGAAMLLTLFAYYQTAFDVGMGRRKMQVLTGLLTGFFCIAALVGTGDFLLYAGGALWALTGLGYLSPGRPKKENGHAAA